MNRMRLAPPDLPPIEYDPTQSVRFGVLRSGAIVLQFLTSKGETHSFALSAPMLEELVADVPEVVERAKERLAAIKKEIKFDVS